LSTICTGETVHARRFAALLQKQSLQRGGSMYYKAIWDYLDKLGCVISWGFTKPTEGKEILIIELHGRIYNFEIFCWGGRYDEDQLLKVLKQYLYRDFFDPYTVKAFTLQNLSKSRSNYFRKMDKLESLKTWYAFVYEYEGNFTLSDAKEWFWID
jgi:hypothetical protein